MAGSRSRSTVDFSKYQAQCAVPTCDVHLDEEIDIYCNTCKKSICLGCTRSSHSNHEYDKINRIVGNFRHKIHDAYTHGPAITKLRRELKAFDFSEYVNKVNLQNTISRIDKTRKELHLLVDAKADEMISVLKMEAKQKQDNLKHSKTKLAKEIQELEDILSFMKESLNSLGNHILLQMKIDYEEKLDQLNTNHGRETCPSDKYYVEGEIIEEEIQSMLGQLTENNPSNVTVYEMESFANNHGDDTILDIVPVSDDRSWIHRENSKQIDLVDKQGVLKQAKDVRSPFDSFAISENDDVFISCTLSRTVTRISKNGARHIVINTGPLRPLGLCLSIDGNLLITMYDKFSYDLDGGSTRLVEQITKNGALVQTYEFDSDGTTRLFTLPRRVAQNLNGDICVVDATGEYSGRLCIIGIDGAMKSVYNGQNRHKKFLPQGVCCGSTCNIIVNEANNYTIHLLNPTGELVKLLDIDDHGLSDNPTALGLYKSSLWIGYNDGRVQVMKYEY